MKEIQKKDIKKGLRFYWTASTWDFVGFYEVVCRRSDLSVILCYKESGKRATLKTEELYKFDERMINNPEFRKALKNQSK